MKIKGRRFIVSIVPLLILAGCGGGGGGSDNVSTDSYTYFNQGGLTWSSPTTKVYGSSGPSVPFDESAGYICSGSVSTNGGAQIPDNFNKTDGWRLPSFTELSNLYKEMPKPEGWVLGQVWDDNEGGMDFSNGGIFGGNGSRAHVACVKEL